MTIKEVLKKYPDRETELLLGHVLKQSKEFLYSNPEKALTKTQQLSLSKLISKRKAGYPIAYLLGYKDFFGLRFAVSPATLIPRPESEWLVERAIKLAGTKPVSIIDIGTGSGCLAISIATKLPQARVTAVDVSARALAIAKQNAQQHKVKVKFRKQSLLFGDNTKYDLIIANLPYVPTADYKKFHSNLRFEPIGALVDSQGDFTLYKQLLSQYSNHLKPNGHLLLEIDPSMKPRLENWHKKNMPRAKLTFTRDIRKLWRYANLNITV